MMLLSLDMLIVIGWSVVWVLLYGLVQSKKRRKLICDLLCPPVAPPPASPQFHYHHSSLAWQQAAGKLANHTSHLWSVPWFPCIMPHSLRGVCIKVGLCLTSMLQPWELLEKVKSVQRQVHSTRTAALPSSAASRFHYCSLHHPNDRITTASPQTIEDRDDTLT